MSSFMQSQSIIFFIKLILILFLFVMTILNQPLFYNFGDMNTTEEFISIDYSNAITKEAPINIVFQPSKKGIKYLSFSVFAQQKNNNSNILCEIQHVNRLNIDDATFRMKTFKTQTMQSVEFTPDELAEMDFQIKIPISTELRTDVLYCLSIQSLDTNPESAYKIQIGFSERTDVHSWFSGIQKSDGIPDVNIVYGSTWWIYYSLMFVFLGAALVCICLPALPKRSLKLAYHIALILFSPAAILQATEKLGQNSISLIRPRVIVLNYLILFLFFVLIFVATKRFSVAIISCSSVFILLSIVNHFVLAFRATVLLPGDFYGLSAALNVMGDYRFSMTPAILHGLILWVFFYCAATRDVVIIKNYKLQITGAVLSLIYAGLMIVMISTPRFYTKAEIGMNWWRQTTASKWNGFYANFVINIPKLIISPPKGYHPQDLAEQISIANKNIVPAAEYLGSEFNDMNDNSIELTVSSDHFESKDPTSPDDDKNTAPPTIIAIMNESFTDFSIAGEVNTNEDPLSYIHALAQEDNPRIFVGNVVVPVFGASTNCSEFEMLTGFSISTHQTISPFGQFIHQATPSVATKLRELGYDTIASHPAEAGNWDRDRVFPLIGFNRSYFESDFINSKRIRGRISDESSFDFIIEQFENKGPEPQYHYNLTIQNHGGYETAPPTYDTIYITGTGNIMASTEEYLSTLRHSDEAFQYLTTYFEQVDEPVIIMMFGDHWPTVDDWFISTLFGTDRPDFNDWQELLIHTTPLIFWANYDIDFSHIPEFISSNYLSAVLMDIAGLPLSPFDTFLLEGMQKYPVFSSFGYIDAQGNYSLKLPEAGQEFKETYEKLQYNGLFDYKKRVTELFIPDSDCMS